MCPSNYFPYEGWNIAWTWQSSLKSDSRFGESGNAVDGKIDIAIDFKVKEENCDDWLRNQFGHF